MLNSKMEFFKHRKTFLTEGIIVFGIFLLFFGINQKAKNNLKANEYDTDFLSSYYSNNHADVLVNSSKEIWKTNDIDNAPETSSKIINRKKRFILFNNGGVVKLVLGVSFPIKLADRVRSLSYFYNLQLQYTPSPIPIYWWSFFNTSAFPDTLRRTREIINDHDISRQFIYSAIENAFDRAGLLGTQCLLKTICEIARSPFYVPRDVSSKANWSIYHEILNTIFSPKYPNVDIEYLHAYQRGVHGALCSYKCSKQNNWLKRNSIYF